MPRTLEVSVVTPQREVWRGEASMVIARGTEGEVGIMAGHAPLLIRLAIGTLRIRRDGAEERAIVDGGFMHVTPGEEVTRVDILADGADMESDIDLAAAERAREDAERRLREREEDEDARADLAKANARLSLRS